MPPSKKPFGRRNLPQKIAPPPIVYHAPEGLGGDADNGRRLRSAAIVLGFCGVATIGGFALVQALRDNRCRDRDSNDPNAPACHSSGGHGGGGSHWFWSSSSGSSGSSGTSQHGVSFGGFGATGESGAHGGSYGGFHGGGFHGGGGS